jgi:hypothetical protein
MTPDDLKARTKKFAVDVIRFTRSIPRDPINDEIASQRPMQQRRRRRTIVPSVAQGREPISSTS